MESFMEIYSGEIMTAFFMLVLMLIIVVNLLLKSQNQTTENLHVPTFRNDIDQQKLKKQRREMGSITSVALLSFALMIGLYFFQNRTSMTSFQPESKVEEKLKEPTQPFYPPIGVNKDRYVHKQPEPEVEDQKVTYSHPPIIPIEFDKPDVTPKAVSNRDGYSCQVGAYSSHDKARKALSKWSEDLNIEGFIALQEGQDGRQLYKVYLGYFASEKAAQDFTKKLGTGYARSREEIPGVRP